MHGLVTQIGLIVLIFCANIAITTTHFRVKRRLQIDWRNWLTSRLVGQWMIDGRHHLITHVQEVAHDNPDGRIAEDIRLSTETAIDLCHSLIYCVLLLGSFTTILWTLSGVVTLSLGHLEIPIYGYLVWLAILYAGSASVLGWWLGRPLTGATHARQAQEANFRFGLVIARENSLAIALAHGETNERGRINILFENLAQAWQEQSRTWSYLFILTSGNSVLLMALPLLLAAPRYIAGEMALGALMQSSQAFQQLAGALSWPVNNMALVAEWRASVERVLGLFHSLDQLDQEGEHLNSNRIRLTRTDHDALCLRDLSLIRRDGTLCAPAINASIEPGERVLITGDPVTGPILFEAIAGLWPWGKNAIELPRDPVFFMPPQPYLPSTSLRAAICYPVSHEEYIDSAIHEALELAGLGALRVQLDQVANWESTLSREQQQRLGVVRLLLKKPRWILLQEAMDSLDSSCELRMLQLIVKELPSAAILSMTNEPMAEAFHHRRIVL